MPAPEWDALSWDLKRTYLEGLIEDPEVPLFYEDGAGEAAPGSGAAGGQDGPQARTAEAGAVIDLTAMIAGFESNPEARRQL